MGPYFAPRDAPTGTYLTVLEAMKRLVTMRDGPETWEAVERIESGVVADIEVPSGALGAHWDAYDTLVTALHGGSLPAIAGSGGQWFDIMSGYWGTRAGVKAARDGRVVVLATASLEELQLQRAPVLIRSNDFELWLSADSQRPPRESAVDAEVECQRWLVGLMSKGPPEKNRDEYKVEAQEKLFKGLSTRAFFRAWRYATIKVHNLDWTKPGRKIETLNSIRYLNS
jgi:hypothetical protein